MIALSWLLRVDLLSAISDSSMLRASRWRCLSVLSFLHRPFQLLKAFVFLDVALQPWEKPMSQLGLYPNTTAACGLAAAHASQSSSAREVFLGCARELMAHEGLSPPSLRHRCALWLRISRSHCSLRHVYGWVLGRIWLRCSRSL